MTKKNPINITITHNDSNSEKEIDDENDENDEESETDEYTN